MRLLFCAMDAKSLFAKNVGYLTSGAMVVVMVILSVSAEYVITTLRSIFGRGRVLSESMGKTELVKFTKGIY